MKLHIQIALFLLLPISLLGQELMSLQDCLHTGLENNYNIRISRNEKEISDNNVTLGNAGYLPSISLNSNYNLRGTNSNQHPRDGSEVVELRNSNAGVADIGVNLNWTIFDGFSVQTNYKRLKELQKMGEISTRMAIENIISAISAEYYNYVQQQIHMENLKYALALSGERLRIVEARYQVGSGSRLDLQQAKVDFNSDSSKLIQQYEVLNNSRILLNELMGVDVNQQFRAADDEISLSTMMNHDDLLSSVMEQNKTLQLAQKNKTLSELELKNLQSRNYPYLRLNSGYGITYSDFNKGSYRSQNNWGPSVGISLGYTLFDGMNRRREQKNAQLTIENRELALQQRSLELESDFTSMWLAYRNNIELTELEKESLENAKLNYEIAMERYKIGDLSGIELREAQNGLLNAEQRLLVAKYRTKLYEISLMQLSGKVGDYLER